MNCTILVALAVILLVTLVWRHTARSGEGNSTMSCVNPPEAVLRNLNRAPERMRMVDGVLGPDVAREFAEGVSRILEHANPKNGAITNCVLDNTLRAHIAIKLLSAAAELETAWDVLRLPNVSAAYRTTRVASEFVGLAVLYAMPRATLMTMSKSEETGRFLKRLKENP